MTSPCDPSDPCSANPGDSSARRSAALVWAVWAQVCRAANSRGVLPSFHWLSVVTHTGSLDPFLHPCVVSPPHSLPLLLLHFIPHILLFLSLYNHFTLLLLLYLSPSIIVSHSLPFSSSKLCFSPPLFIPPLCPPCVLSLSPFPLFLPSFFYFLRSCIICVASCSFPSRQRLPST